MEIDRPNQWCLVVARYGELYPKSDVAQLLKEFGPQTTSELAFLHAGRRLQFPTERKMRRVWLRAAAVACLKGRRGRDRRVNAELFAERYGMKNSEAVYALVRSAK